MRCCPEDPAATDRSCDCGNRRLHGDAAGPRQLDQRRQHHWHRALCLSIAFDAGAGNRLETIERALFDAFDRACEASNGAEPLLYLRPLQAEHVGTHAGAIANRLQQLADER